MAAKLSVGDDATLHGVVRLVGWAGDGTVTIELEATGQRLTVRANSRFMDLAGRAQKPAAVKKPARRKPLFYEAE